MREGGRATPAEGDPEPAEAIETHVRGCDLPLHPRAVGGSSLDIVGGGSYVVEPMKSRPG